MLWCVLLSQDEARFPRVPTLCTTLGLTPSTKGKWATGLIC